MAAPRDVVVVLLDSLNRHLLGSYGGTEFDTPNLDRLAARSVRFTNHHTGSLPCMPARHDLLVRRPRLPVAPVGLDRGVGGRHHPPPAAGRRDLARCSCRTTPTCSRRGGENYHTDFGAWDYLRGHEDDPWRTRPDPSWIGAPALPARRPPWERGYDISRTWFTDEADFPGPADDGRRGPWLDGELCAERQPRRARPARGRRVRPARALRRAGAVGEPVRPRLGGRAAHLAALRARARSSPGLTDRESVHLRRQYGAKLSMIDHWLGRILDVVDRHQAWDTTAVILCTDHGHYLGERGFWGKPQVPVHPELGHIPLLVSWPGVAPARTTPSPPPSTCTPRSATSSP